MGQEEIIAKRYAAGLAERATETDEVKRVRTDLRLMAGLINPRSEEYVPEMADFLASPRVEAKDKIAAAGSILGKLGVSETAKDFFRLLVEHGRVALLPRIHARFNLLAGELTGEYVGVVETARPLSDDQLDRLNQVLSNAFGATVRLHQQIEPALIAGAKITVGDKTFDGSVLGKWRRLKNRLTSGDLLERAVRDEADDDSEKD